MATAAPVDEPAPTTGDATPVLKLGGLVFWLAAFGLVQLLAWLVVPSFQAMFQDLGEKKLPPLTVLVIDSAIFLRSPPGSVVSLLLVAGSALGYFRASRSRRFRYALGTVTLAAYAWILVHIPALFLPLDETIKSIK